jgi:di/tricarboxylate transporter
VEFDAWLTLAVVVAMLAGLAREVAPPAALVLGATVTLLVCGVLTEEQAFAGFSNAAPLTVAALYVLARAAEKTGLMGPLVSGLLGARRKLGTLTIARLLLPTAGTSAFINNTPLVAMLIPEVMAWCAKRNVSASKLLLPVSFAAILGGTVTLIGTSTNLVVSGLYEEAGGEPFGLFELAPIGGVSALIGLVVLVALAPRVIPDRKGIERDLDEMREFVVSMEVEVGGKLDNKTVEEAGLRDLEGVYLVEVERRGRMIAPIPPSFELEGGDRLTFAGQVDLVVDLQRTPGLRSHEDEHLLAVESPMHTFYEAVIGPGSPLVGRSLAEADFRSRYRAAVLAIHRSGDRVKGKLGQIPLRAGDTLLLLGGSGFRTRWRESRDFLLVSELGGTPPSASRKAPIVGLTALGVIVLAAFEVLPILQLALIGAAVLIGTRVLTVAEARDSIDLDVIILIAAAFGVGAAIETTGLAETLATGLVDVFEPLGDLGVIVGLLVATSLLTEIITNNAAAAVLFPIAVSVATVAGLDPRIMAIAIAVTASSSFLTPLGYQTNTMVYGPGGYKFSDYARIGIPLNIVTGITVCLIIPLLWPLTPG